jgi:hypothetical protein
MAGKLLADVRQMVGRSQANSRQRAADTMRWQDDAAGGWPMTCRRVVVRRHIADIRQADSSKGHAGRWRKCDRRRQQQMANKGLTDG